MVSQVRPIHRSDLYRPQVRPVLLSICCAVDRPPAGMLRHSGMLVTSMPEPAAYEPAQGSVHLVEDAQAYTCYIYIKRTYMRQPRMCLRRVLPILEERAYDRGDVSMVEGTCLW